MIPLGLKETKELLWVRPEGPLRAQEVVAVLLGTGRTRGGVEIPEVV